MPGLVGYLADSPLEAGLIHAMAAPMRHRPAYQVQARTDGVWAMATIDLAAGRQAHWAGTPDGRYRLVVFGAIYETWALDAADLAATLLSRWMASGASALIDLNGEYLIVVWDRDEQRLTIVNDRLGLKRLQLWHDGTALAFASELKSLAVLPRVSRAINEQALAELLTFGHLQDDRTLLRDVTLLPPASVLAWQRGRLSVASYWRYEFRADPALEDPTRAADEYAHRVETAVARRLHGHQRVGVLLSGGLDSRALAGMARRLRPADALLTWTSGHAHADDVRFAKQMARVIRSRHASVTIPETFLQDYGSDYSWLLDGMVSTHGSHRACLVPFVANRLDVLIIGYLGDHISGGTPLDKVLPLRTLDELIEGGLAIGATGFDEALLERTLRPAVHHRVRGLIREAYAKTVVSAQVEHPADRVVVADLIHRQRLWNPPAQLDLLGADCRIATPFADRDFIDFALRLPVSQRVGKRAYLEMIRRACPALARVPRSGDGLSLAPSRLRAAAHWRWVLFRRYTLPSLTRGRIRPPHPTSAYVHCSEWFRRANRRFIDRTLIDSPVLDEHFQMDALNRLVRSFLEDTASQDLMEAIAALMSYVLFRERLHRFPLAANQPEVSCAAS